MLKTKEFCFFSGESYFIKAIENFFPVISGYANTENVFYCLYGCMNENFGPKNSGPVHYYNHCMD